jgi:hypothetical protein
LASGAVAFAPSKAEFVPEIPGRILEFPKHARPDGMYVSVSVLSFCASSNAVFGASAKVSRDGTFTIPSQAHPCLESVAESKFEWSIGIYCAKDDTGFNIGSSPYFATDFATLRRDLSNGIDISFPEERKRPDFLTLPWIQRIVYGHSCGGVPFDRCYTGLTTMSACLPPLPYSGLK